MVRSKVLEDGPDVRSGSPLCLCGRPEGLTPATFGRATCGVVWYQEYGRPVVDVSPTTLR